MKNKLYITLETISTVCWLLMDFCWMSKYVRLASFFSIFAITFSCLSIILYKGNSTSELIILVTSLMWIMMNSFWMSGDELNQDWLISIAKIIFVVSLILVLIAVIVSKKENKSINFNRLKIKEKQ